MRLKTGRFLYKKIMEKHKYIATVRILLICIMFLGIAFSTWSIADARRLDFGFKSEPKLPLVTTLTINPVSANITIDETVVVDVVVEGESDLYGVALELTFDPTLVEVVDADTGTAGVQITPGSCPVADFVVQNTVNNSTGVINYDAASLSPTAACNGTGVVASITFRGLSEGTSPVHYNSWLLADSNGLSITASTQDGSVTVDYIYRIFLPLILKDT